ncbi:MAG: hypothetical protein LR011_12600, partial [Verrucomicrobia bacterium]|nr:hypothetical protein [Verrucomicrobiota bacterium]
MSSSGSMLTRHPMPAGWFLKCYRLPVTLLYSFLFLSSLWANPSDPNQFFENNVKPLLESHCLECHSHQFKIRGGLSLDYRDSVLAGGLTGPAVDLKNPDQSILIQAVQHSREDLRMPKDKPKLRSEDIFILQTWIATGLADTRTPPAVLTRNPKDHWAFQPVSKPIPPKFEGQPEFQNVIDSFIQA